MNISYRFFGPRLTTSDHCRLSTSSVGQSITVNGAMATLVIRKTSCADAELPFKVSWACVNDSIDAYTPQESGSFVNYEEGMIARYESDTTGYVQRQTTAIVSDAVVCLRVNSKFSSPYPNLITMNPCEISSVSVHRIEPNGCLFTLHRYVLHALFSF